MRSVITVTSLSWMLISANFSFCQDTNINIEEMPERELFRDSSTVNNNADTLNIDQVISNTKEQPNPYDYNQLFMFGFLILGAVLVVWKFSGKGKY